MDDSRALLNALNALDPAKCSYSEWIQVGMALKSEGLPCSVWDDWSRRDSARYVAGDCEKKWETFQDSGTNGGTIVYLAEHYDNYSPYHELDWDDGLDAYYEEVLTIESRENEKPYQMAARFLETLFQPDESVSYVHSAKWKEDKAKWVPADAGHVRNVGDIIKDLRKHRKLEDAFGTFKDEAGGWIRINPTTGPNDKQVTRFAYSLAESDDLSIEDQKKLFINFKLPIATLVESGGKSVHALVKIDAKDEAEYKQRVSFLYDWLAKHKFVVDENNKNPARLSRLPGVMRNGKLQKLVATNIGCASWLEWIDYIEGIDDDLPVLRSLGEQLKDPPELSPELIGGILREGCKMIITGESKAGKTCLSQNLAVCIAEGMPWLGKFPCEQGKVLYINLEVEEASLYYRFKAMYKAMNKKVTNLGGENIVLWNLRGHAAPMEKLAPKIIRRCRNSGPYKAIIIDPLYKVQQGDENSAEAIMTFCNALDKIAHETGAAIIYDHHHPKGNAREKVIDRGAGSGVFSRDADALIDISNLDPGNDAPDLVKSLVKEGERPMVMSFVLRDFKDIEEQKIWFKFPLHYIDEAGLLENCHIEGSAEANFGKNPNKRSLDEKARIVEFAFNQCQRGGIARLSEMEQYTEVKSRTLKEWAGETGLYELGTGYIKRKDIS
jgi:hypothetical protein